MKMGNGSDHKLISREEEDKKSVQSTRDFDSVCSARYYRKITPRRSRIWRDFMNILLVYWG